MIKSISNAGIGFVFLDIAANKLLTVTQRNEAKDFVDLYYVLQKFTFWDLRTAVQVKFNVEIEPFTISADFLLVENFTALPRMIRPLTLPQLKEFYRDLAQELARTVVE